MPEPYIPGVGEGGLGCMQLMSAPSTKPQNTSKNFKPIMHNAVSTGKNCAKIRISNVHAPKMAVSQGVYGKMYRRHLL